MDPSERPSLRSPPQAWERPLAPLLFLQAASQLSQLPFSSRAFLQVWPPLLPELLLALLLAPSALQFVARACSLLLALALSAFALRLWLEPVPQVSPVFAKLALPESAAPVS
jgi:hypothetical protein